jgi:hypothetical protein
MVWLAYGCSTELVLFAPTESISSMKITHGALSFAASAEQNNIILQVQATSKFNWRETECHLAYVLPAII